MRKIVWFLTFALTSSAFAAMPIPLLKLDANPDGIDMIVTGQNISDDQKKRWDAARKQEEECPECVVEQAFPGDEEVAETE